MKKIIPILTAVLLVLPVLVLAQTPPPTPLENVINTLRTLMDSVIPLFMVVAMACFLWGIVSYITAAGDEEKIKSSRGYIIYGLIGVFVMVAFWGIIQMVASTFGIGVGGTVAPPKWNP